MRREESRLFPGGEDAARRMERRAGDVGHILAPQWELDRRPVDGAVPGLAGEPQHGMGDAAFGALRRKLANPVLHLLQAPSDDADDIDADLRVAMDQVEQLGLAPARLQRFGEGDRVGGIAAIGEERDRPEHLAGPDEADDDLGAVAAGLGDAHAALDHRVGAHAVVALAEDAKILRQAPHARASGGPRPGLRAGVRGKAPSRQGPGGTNCALATMNAGYPSASKKGRCLLQRKRVEPPLR